MITRMMTGGDLIIKPGSKRDYKTLVIRVLTPGENLLFSCFACLRYESIEATYQTGGTAPGSGVDGHYQQRRSLCPDLYPRRPVVPP